MPRTFSFPSERLAMHFPRHVRERGRAYWVEDRVAITFGDVNMVQATVRGTTVYSVVIERIGDRLSMTCACEHFAGGENCKHLWAVLLACDEAGYLMSAAESGDAAESPLRSGPRAWERHLQNLAERPASPAAAAVLTHAIPPSSEILYVAQADTSAVLAVVLCERKPRKTGGWSKLQAVSYEDASAIAAAREPDRDVIGWLQSSRGPVPSWQPGYATDVTRYQLQGPLARHVAPLLCATGRFFLRRRHADPDSALAGPLAWDGGGAWELVVGVHDAGDQDDYIIEAWLARGSERRDLTSAYLISSGLVFFDSVVAVLDIGDGAAWLAQLRQAGRIVVPKSDAPRFQQLLAETPRPKRLELPPELRLDEIAVAPRPRLNVHAARPGWGRTRDLHSVEVSFDYDGVIVRDDDVRGRVTDIEHGRVLVRDRTAENRAVDRLHALGAQADPWAPRTEPRLALTEGRLRGALRALVLEGWQVNVEGSRYRVASALRFGVTSGIDWFDVHGDVSLDDGSTLPMSAVLDALRKGEREVTLGIGDTVVLPEDWDRRYGFLARVGERAEDGLRFSKRQVGLLDALLAAQPEVSVDATFERARERLRRFDRVEPVREPRGFKGELRPYQREGLGWLRFLQEFGFGGCLADDMGLGKTVQVLALLAARRGKAKQPSLVVAPRSLVFNWIDEAHRFAPGLKVVDQSGGDRQRDPAAWKDADVVIITYGILRRDAVVLEGAAFDYVILDEAQAIKNAQSETAKAARLLKAEHRLALSGTPIENHLGEIWSLFEFLNPGLLGRAGAFQSALDADEGEHALVASVLRPFMLRRTKEQVVKELPGKTEQTLYVDLEGEQLTLYRTLREQYRTSVLAEVDSKGLARSKMHVLEALLRLRQAACHPALIAGNHPRATSAKLDALVPLLAEVIDEGHKVLVFSQFTSFLKLLVPLLEKQGTVFEYLDGQTRDRAARVRRFQEDPACSAFLISLKAGGLGLNLTAADYVFILDPWWNPAAEAQALDRAHRLGQTRPVMAYRLIARGTVEEKVLELQKSKRALADAILTEDMSLIRGIAREDLEALLS